ncbi:hypothetical protein U9M48_038809 [Paspalum notatum var. saurae]|uniref:Reverse transcriptase Ty1/copia-type domain-containing protein n=1 Tax=Paspalum notatum var. saurae TaxID=547442 RepID=A0AAQ3UM47_PASNO
MPATLEFATPPMGELDLDDDHDDAPLRFRTLDNVLGPRAPPGQADRAFTEELLAAIGEEPATVDEAKATQEWCKAMLDELASVEENKTWSLVQLPKGHRAIGLKWVFKLKRDEHGEVIKHKARLVAKGYVQRQGIDFDEVFAPVARMETVRVILAVAAHHGWSVHHMDVKTAFLNGDLQEEVYVTQPPGFTAAGHEDKVLKLHKALYGLRQAPRAWNAKLDTNLHQLGFTRSKAEHGLYTRSKEGLRMVIAVYVDDLLITGEQLTGVKSVKDELKSLFRMSDLGLLSYYLGLEVKQGNRGIELRQSAYAVKLLEKAGMGNCNPCAVPMEARLKLSKQSTSPAIDATMYRSLIGSLRYLLHTRPDLSFSVGYLSRYMEDPRQEHMAAMKHLLRYVAGTTDHGLWYSGIGGGQARLQGCSDSIWPGMLTTARVQRGVIFFLGPCPVSWLSQKQRVVALSSCEAEFIAGAAAACQATWLARLLEDVTGVKSEPPQLRMDNNMAAIALCKNPVLHDRSKHIDTKFHFIRECVDRGDVTLEFQGMQGQLADVLTKPLGKARFQELREKIGVIKLN